MHVPLGDTYYVKFTTRQFSSGAPFTLAGTPAVSVYEEANVTQITAGITLTADYDSVTGLNDLAIVASGANGYEVGKYYSVVITTGTVDSVSVVGEVVGHFRVMPAEDAGAGIPDVNATHVGDTSQTGGDIAALVTTVDTVVDGIQTDLSNGTDGLGAIKTDTAAILADTGTDGVVVASGSKTGYSLTATTGLGNQTANITGNLSGSVGSVTGAVGSVTGAVGSVTGAVGSVAGNVDGNVTGSVGSLATQAKADVNAEALDVLNTDTFAEPGQGAPGATISLAAKIGYLYKAWRNKSTQTATTYSLYADDTTTVDQKATVSDDATTATKGEVATGP